MGFLKKLFGKKETSGFAPDNSELIRLLNNFANDESSSNYEKVINELMGDKAFLVVPTFNDEKDEIHEDQWKTLKAGAILKFTTIFDIEGLLVMGVFSSPEKLLAWSEKPETYTCLPSKVVLLEIAKNQGIGRIVIDSNQDTMFVLERDASNIKQEVIKEETQVLIWYPEKPIEGAIKERLIKEFEKVSVIEEVYHFGMTKNNENIYILAIKLSQNTENSRLAVLGALNNGIDGDQLELPLELIYIAEGDRWMETAREFDLFYKKRGY